MIDRCTEDLIMDSEWGGVCGGNCDGNWYFPSQDQDDNEHDNNSACTTQTQTLTTATTTTKTRLTALSRALSLSPCGTLEVLDLRGAGLRQSDASVLVEVLKSLASAKIKTVRLGHNQLGDEGTLVLTSALGALTELQTLELNHNGLCDEACQCLSWAASSFTTTTTITNNTNHTRKLYLNLAGNRIGELGVRSLATMVGAGLYRLDLSDNAHAGSGGCLCDLVVAALRAETDGNGENGCDGGSLRELVLDRTGMDHHGCRAVGQWLEHSSVQVLSLNGNGLSEPDLNEVIRAVMKNRHRLRGSLRELSLSHNRLTDVGASSLLNALWGCTSLQTLCLEGNPQLGDSTAMTIAALLASDRSNVVPSLRVLRLGGAGTRVTSRGSNALFKSLAVNRRVESFGFHGPSDATELAEVLRKHPRLTEVEVTPSDRNWRPYDRQRLVGAALSNRRLRLQVLSLGTFRAAEASVGLPASLQEWPDAPFWRFARYMWTGLDRPNIDDEEGPADMFQVVDAARRLYDELTRRGLVYAFYNAPSIEEFVIRHGVVLEPLTDMEAEVDVVPMDDDSNNDRGGKRSRSSIDDSNTFPTPKLCRHCLVEDGDDDQMQDQLDRPTIIL